MIFKDFWKNNIFRKKFNLYDTFSNLNFDMINYVSNGFSLDFQKKYDIIYGKNDVKLFGKLEDKVLKDVNVKSDIDISKVNPYEKIKLDYLKEVNRLASSVVETYNKVKEKVVDATIEVFSGGYRINFVKA